MAFVAEDTVREVLEQLVEALGLEGADIGFEAARDLPAGAVVQHE